MKPIHEITFQKERYHLQDDMQKWCEQFIGPGSWTFSHSNNWEGTRDLWRMSSTFGTTTFSFKHERDYHWFFLKWK